MADGKNHKIDEDALRKYLAIKDEINKDLWNDIKSRLKGDIDSQKGAIKDFFNNYSTIPYEANQYLIDFIDVTEDIEILRFIGEQYATTSAVLPASFELNLTSRLRKIEDDELQVIIKDKIEKLDKLSKSMVNTLRMARSALVNSIRIPNFRNFYDAVSASTASTFDFTNNLKFEIEKNIDEIPSDLSVRLLERVEAIEEIQRTSQTFLKTIAENTAQKTLGEKVTEWILRDITRLIVTGLATILLNVIITLIAIRYMFGFPLW